MVHLAKMMVSIEKMVMMLVVVMMMISVMIILVEMKMMVNLDEMVMMIERVMVMLLLLIMDGDRGADGGRDGDDEKDTVMQFLAHKKERTGEEKGSMKQVLISNLPPVSPSVAQLLLAHLPQLA